ncbi:DUF4260 family protein [Agromyces protaetiae]|uniref:DUF4260 family protein n=2 Tax=Agromyces protaetiae TaxID=2509455 RepID=A0A4P6FLJ4_9MICO|nr:DUF4260 family protein [Agromyces protaetiae]
MTATVVWYPAWWWVPLAGFVLFDLSALGYLRSPAIGAWYYNGIHNYTGPALAAAAALVIAPAPAQEGLSTVLALIACSWAFHVGVDRMLGFGLKYFDAFTHTHLGRIGRT